MVGMLIKINFTFKKFNFVEIFGTLVNTELRFSGIKWYFDK